MKQKISLYLLFFAISFMIIYLSDNELESDKEKCTSEGGVYFYDYSKDVGRCQKLF
jgi:hypothetical protein